MEDEAYMKSRDEWFNEACRLENEAGSWRKKVAGLRAENDDLKKALKDDSEHIIRIVKLENLLKEAMPVVYKTYRSDDLGPRSLPCRIEKASMSNEVTAIFDGLNKLSQIKQLNDQYSEYEQTDRKRCGSCNHWMKSSQCPKEKNVKGRSCGPSANAYACDKFLLQEWVRELKEKRKNLVVERFRELDLAVPQSLVRDTGCKKCDELKHPEICKNCQLEQAEADVLKDMNRVEELKQKIKKEKQNAEHR